MGLNYQHAFIANVAIESMLKSSNKGVIYKMDIKEYAHVNWEFLLAILEKMSFGLKWMRWIKWCISSENIYVLY